MRNPTTSPFKLKNKNDFDFGNKEVEGDLVSNKAVREDLIDKSEVSEFAGKYAPKKEEEEASDLDLYTDAILNPSFKKGNLSLKANFKPFDGTEVGWNTDGNLTPYGSPTVNVKNKAGISGEYKIGKNTTIGGNVSYETGKKPIYGANLKINI